MKALGYQNAHALGQFSITEVDIPKPILRPHDVLVQVKAFALNPVDYKIRLSRSAKEKNPVILGWDASGIVMELGSEVVGFKAGDEVFYAGDLMRDGCYSEFQAVDYRIIAQKPATLAFREACALPLTSLTAWESLFERGVDYTDQSKVLIIGGAGGVGSIATQLLKAKTKAKVIATASRPESAKWCQSMGADIVIDHSKNLQQELSRVGCENLDFVFGTMHSEKYLSVIPHILRPFGHFCLIDDHVALNIADFKMKSLSVHWELMFSKTLFQFDLRSQGQILQSVSRFVDEGRLKSTACENWTGFTAENIKRGHEILESGKSLGKIVIELTN